MAFRQLEADIMVNFAILVPGSLSFDRLISTVMDIEKFLKDNPESDTGERNPLEIISDFLQGESTDVRVI